MHILITGAAGFIGMRLARRLLAEGQLTTARAAERITRLTVLDHVPVQGLPADPRLRIIIGNAADAATLALIT